MVCSQYDPESGCDAEAKFNATEPPLLHYLCGRSPGAVGWDSLFASSL